LQPTDMHCAQALGHRIKLLGVARCHSFQGGDAVQLGVYPALVPATHLLAGVGGALNAIVVQGDASGPTVHVGAGAGSEPTASAVVADLMDLARLSSHPLGAAVPPLGLVPALGVHPWAVQDLPVLPMQQVCTPHCLRVPVAGPQQALAGVAACLAQAGVPVQSLGFAPPSVGGCHVLAMTAPASGERVDAALAALQALPGRAGEAVHLRVETLT
jgi:homoserine dehydrogenase